MRGKKELVLLIVGLALFLLDVSTDCYVAYEYKRQGENGWFDMTITFIIIPFFIVSFMACVQTGAFGKKCFTATIPCLCCDLEDWPFCFCIFGFIQFLLFSVVDRYIHQLILWKRKYYDSPTCSENYGECNCERCKRYREVESESNESAYALAWIRYIETLLESTPQWCLQVYVMLSQWSFPWYSVLSTTIALFSLAWSDTALEKARVTKNGHNFNLKSTILYFISQLAVLVARLVSIVTCAYAMKTGVFWVLITFWFILNVILTFVFCGYMVVSCCCGDRKCCDGSIKTIFKKFMLTFPLTFYVSETALEALGFSALWIKMFLFVAKSLENLFMLMITTNYSLPHLNIWMPIAWSLLGIGTLSGFISLILRHLPKRREEPASPDANGDEGQVNSRRVRESGATSAINRGYVM